MSGQGNGATEDLVSPSSVELLRRLKRIEGQVRGLQRMIEEGRACSEVLMQLTALREALNKVGVAMIVRHMEACLREEVDRGGERPEGQDEATAEPEAGRRSARLKEAVQMFLRFS